MQNIDTGHELEHAVLKRSHRRIVLIFILLFLAFVGLILLVTAILFPFIKTLTATAMEAPPTLEAAIGETHSVSPGSPYVSPVIAFDKPFSSAGLMWDQSMSGEVLAVSVRTSGDNKTWSDWYEVSVLAQNPPHVYGEMIILPSGSRLLQVRAELEDGVADEAAVGNIHIAVFPDQTKSLIVRVIQMVRNIAHISPALAQDAAADITVIPRSGWGANEDWRYCTSWDSANNTCKTKATDPIWTPQTYPVKKFILHHTGGSNESTIDPKEAIRNIYLWHAISLGWGDIGYNYVVDQNGNVYEGRFGGDGVQGGHVFNGPFCKRIGTVGKNSDPCSVASGDVETGFQMNAGSSGIAVLGNFDVESPNETIKTAIAKLISAKAKAYGIDLNASADWSMPAVIKSPADLDPNIAQGAAQDAAVSLLTGKSSTFELSFTDPTNPQLVLHGLPAIIAHRDIDHTTCPGDSFYAQIESIRRLAINPITEYEAQFLSTTLPVAIYIAKTASVEIKLQNTGSRVWNKSDVELRIFDDGRKASLFKDASWKDPAGKIKFEGTTVAPGQTATFKLIIKSPRFAGTYKNEFALFKTADQTEVFGSAFDRLLRVDEVYQGTFVSSSLPVAVRTPWRPTLNVAFKNTGFNTWSSNTKLEIYDASGGASKFAAKTWSGPVAATAGKATKSGSTLTFTTKLIPPKTPGVYRQIFKLKDGKREIWIGGLQASILTRVDQ